MKRFILAFFTFVLFHLTALAQKEANMWYFGDHAALDFNSGVPVALSDSEIVTQEGCASIADADGNLLFYTDGSQVWNKDHQIMANGNGLNGADSSTQSAIIVPKPGSDHIYYLFTVPVSSSVGLQYSEIDMQLDNGLGAVTANKNILLVSPVAEKLTGVFHANGTDIWVVTHGFNSNAYISFLITDAGVNTNAVTTNIGMNINSSGESIGYMKLSPDGSKLGCAIKDAYTVELLDFDNSTGTVSNLVTLQSPGGNGPYGLEFSPNSKLLYVEQEDIDGGDLAQYNLESGDSLTIVQSKVAIPTGASFFLGAMQIGPDEKIYVNRYLDPALAVIHSPNLVGPACNFDLNGVNLGGGISRIGLPDFLSSFFVTLSFTSTPTCFGDTTFFSSNLADADIDSLFWDFGDPGSGLDNFSTLEDPIHIYPLPGDYEVTFISYQGPNTDTVVQTITIGAPFDIELGNDTIMCENTNFVLGSTLPAGGSYEWQDGFSQSEYTVDESGAYSVLVEIDGCTASDTISVEFLDLPDVTLGNDTMLCEGQILVLDPGNFEDYIWQDNSTDPTFEVTTAGMYSVTVTGTNGCTNSDSMGANFFNAPNVDLGDDVQACFGDVISLDVSTNQGTYLWQDGSTSPNYLITEAGTYSVTVTTGPCSASDTLNVGYNDLLEVDLGNDTSLCEGNTLLLSPGNFDNYLWQDNSVSSTFEITTAGLYALTVTDLNNCTASATISVDYTAYPEVDFGEDIISCIGDIIMLDATASASTYLWQDGSTGPTFSVEADGLYSVEVARDDCVTLEEIMISFDDTLSFDLGLDTILCFEEILLLTIGQEAGSYTWQDNSEEASFTVEEAGTYTLTATNACGSATDSIFVDYENCNCEVLFPNAFTPDADGANDLFRALAMCEFETFHLRIFNRWGSLVYENEASNTGWNGYYNGQPQPSDVYIYILEYKNERQEGTLTGEVTLIR